MDEDEINQLLGALGKEGVNDSILEKAKASIKDAIKSVRAGFQSASAEEFKGATAAAIRQLAQDLRSDNPDITAAMSSFSGNIKRALKTAVSNAAAENIFGPEFTKGMERGKNALKGAFERMSEDAKLKVKIDLDDPSSILAGLKDVAGVGIGFGMAKGFDEAGKKINEANRFAQGFIGNLDDYRRTAGEISKVQINPFEGSARTVADSAGAAGREGARKFEENFSKEAINLRFRFGISADDAQRELAAVYSGLENYGAQLEGIELKAKIDGQDKVISGAEAIATAARATGIDIQTMTSAINDLTFTMDANGAEAVTSIETIAKAAANTLLPVNRFHKEVMTAAGQFSDFGDNTEEAAAMLDRFISKADPNRIGASVKAFQSVASGIAGMADEMKAFIGMGTDLAGGGGAIESIVRLDAALQSGDKDALQGIFDEAISRIEELSGAPVMTLQEAVASGQESTFYQQAKMLEQMGLGRGSAQASDIFAASKRGAIDVETIRAQGGAGLAAGAIEKAGFGRGVLDIAEQQAGAAADLARFNAAYSEGSVKIMDTSARLADGLLSLGNTVAGTASVMDALARFGVKDFAVTETSAATGEAAVAEGVRRLQGIGSMESRAAIIDAQTTSAKEIQAAVNTSQATVIEELTAAKTDIGATVKIETDRAITALGGSATETGAGQGGLAAIDTAARMISEAADKIGQLQLQIELKGEAKEWFRAEALKAGIGAVQGAVDGFHNRS